MNQKLGIINQESEVMNIKAGIRKYESNFSECKSMNKNSLFCLKTGQKTGTKKPRNFVRDSIHLGYLFGGGITKPV